ncbi:MAG: DoxX family protein [Gemmatimonas sp.]
MFAKAPTKTQTDVALLALRVISGLGMAAHGYQKVFTFGLDGITQGFAGMGIPMAGVVAPAISFLELIGGVLIAIGFLTRPIALLLMADMFVAAFFVHLKDGFFAPKGAELTMLFMVNYLVLVLMGAGSFSIDHSIGKNKE